MRMEKSFFLFLNFVFVSGFKNTFGVYYPDYKKQEDFKWGNALNVMTYHRDKMNEYLCKSYIAREIVEGFRNLSKGSIDKRNGRPQRSLSVARESLLADQGSKKYKDWLSRSSTLEDIYHQFEHSEAESLGHAELEQEHESGQDEEMTGYALLDSKHLYSKPIEYETGTHYYSTAVDPHYNYDEVEEKDEEKGIKLKELFHFALTSIAFLAFATFMIEVIMCLMEIPSNSNSDYLLVATGPTGSGAGSKIETEVSEGTRQSRSLILDPLSLEALNIISSKVLSSIESLAMLHEDNGECFQRALCQNSKYSKTLTGPKKIWLPLWSFGISWIGSRLIKKKNPTSDTNALKYLKAAAMGLGSKECHDLHPNCDERRRRRKKKLRS